METVRTMIQDPDWDFLYYIDTMSLKYIARFIVPEISRDMDTDREVIHRYIHAVKGSDILIQSHSWFDELQKLWRFTLHVYREVDCRHHKYMGTLPLGLLSTMVSNNFPDTADYDSGGGMPNRAVKNENGDYEVYIWNP